MLDEFFKELIVTGEDDVCRDLARKSYRSDCTNTVVPFKPGAIPVDIEWIKWLSYESEYEKKRIEYLNSKKVSELTEEEIEESSRYKRNRTFARLFKIYGTSECSEEDYMKVFDYMNTESIDKLMLSKLTSEELKYAMQEIARLNEVPLKQLNAKVEEEQNKERYEQLSMVDAYVLHIISEINYDKKMSNFIKFKESQIQLREANLIHELRRS